MKKLAVLLACFAVASLLSADYYLVEPDGRAYKAEKTERGWEPTADQPSHLKSFSKGFIDTVFWHDTESAGWYYPNRDSNTVVLQYFNSEYACSLIEMGISYYSAGWADFYVWEAPNPFPTSTSELEASFYATWEYDDNTSNWVTMPTILFQDVIGSDDPPDDLVSRTCWVDIDPNLDIGNDYVFVGYRILDRTHGGTPYGGKPWPQSDGWYDPLGRGAHWVPSRTWMFRVQETSGLHLTWTDYTTQTGDWEYYYVIDIYANAPPSVASSDRVLGSYDLSARTIQANIRDFGVPAESSGVDEAWLFYYLNDDMGTLDSLPMSMVSGTVTDGVWEATIPAQSANTEVTHYFWMSDIQGLYSDTHIASWSYYLGEGHPEHILFHIGQIVDYGPHDPVSAARSQVDVWDEGEYGVADHTVIDYYTTGPGEKGIIWLDWTGSTMIQDTAVLADFFDAGGALLLSQMDIPADFEMADDPADFYGHWTANPLAFPFPYNYLACRSGWDDYEAIDTFETFEAYGIPGDPITGDPEFGYIQVTPASNWTGIFDSVATGGNEILYGPSFEICGYRWEGAHKLVHLYFFFHEIGTMGTEKQEFVPDTIVQNLFVRNALNWLGIVTGVEESPEPEVGGVYSLLQNSPNPVRREMTTIAYTLPRAEKVSLNVYDITGSLVKTLVNKEVAAGAHTEQLDMSGFAAGVYFYRLEAGEFTATRKIVNLR